MTLDGNGNVVTTDDYYPFGLTLPGRSYNIALTGNRYKYSGKELDEEGGLDWYYFGARYYDAEIGRWLAVDPLAHIYPGYSPFSYVGNNPIVNIDPNGESWYSYSEEYEEEEEYTDDDGNTKTRTVTKTRQRFIWVDDDKNDFITTTSGIVNNNTTDGQTDWSAVNSADGSSVYSIDGYLVVAGVLQGGILYGGGEGGFLNYLDFGGNIHQYVYLAVGGGLSPTIPGLMVGGMLGGEAGWISTDKAGNNLGGTFWGVSGFAAAKWGLSASFTFTGLFTNPTFTVGGGVGLGAGLSGQVGKSHYIKSFHFKDLLR